MLEFFLTYADQPDIQSRYQDDQMSGKVDNRSDPDWEIRPNIWY